MQLAAESFIPAGYLGWLCWKPEWHIYVSLCSSLSVAKPVITSVSSQVPATLKREPVRY